MLTSWHSPASPKTCGRKIWSNSPSERLNKEVRRRTDAVGLFPNRDAIVRLVGALLAEQIDEWAEGRRYLGLEVLARRPLTPVTDTTTEVTPDPVLVLSVQPNKGSSGHYTTPRDLTAHGPGAIVAAPTIRPLAPNLRGPNHSVRAPRDASLPVREPGVPNGKEGK